MGSGGALANASALNQCPVLSPSPKVWLPLWSITFTLYQT